jgi:hypothetical protein
MNRVEFTIPVNLVTEAERRVQRAINQAAKLGETWKPRLEQLGSAELVEVNGKNVARQRVALYIPVLDLGDWRLIGRAALLNNGADGFGIVTRLIDDAGVPPAAWDVSNKCGHCGFERKRNTVYILQHKADAAEIIHVGSSCVDDFLGGASIGLIQALEAVVSWGEHAASKTKRGEYAEPERFKIDDILAWGVACADAVGYQKAGQRNAFNDDRYAWRYGRIISIHDSPPTFVLALEAWEYARDATVNAECQMMAMVIADYARDFNSVEQSKYALNLSALYNQALLTRKEISENATLLFSAIGVFQYHMKHHFGPKKPESAPADMAAPQGPDEKNYPNGRWQKDSRGYWIVVVPNAPARIAPGWKVRVQRKSDLKISVETVRSVEWRGTNAACEIER